MPIAISEDHRALADAASDLLTKRDARLAARALLEAPDESLPAFWRETADLGWLGLHLPERYGGSGFGIEELVIVVEQLGRAVAPGPFVPTVIVSAVVAAGADEATRARLLPGLASGDRTGGVALTSDVTVSDGRVTGEAGPVLGAALATVLVLPVGEDVAVVETGDGVTVESPPNLDPTRRSGRVALDGAVATVIPGGRRLLVDLARTILAAEAVGVAGACTDAAAEYARIRVQFGRPIGMFQAVKHHCANMCVASEKATAAAWDAARAVASGGDQLTYAAAAAAALAGPAAYLCANLNTQVHGGIGFTWEHDAHLYLRRATVLQALLAPETAAADLVELSRRGVSRDKTIELPPEAEAFRAEIRAFTGELAGLEKAARRRRLIDTGYLMPHWPRPWGREAGAVEQVVIEQELMAAGIDRRMDPITGYQMVTLIQHATAEQVARWVPPALAQETIWCQLFSEPEAGSDAAGVRTRATRAEGGWLLNGQKVWTSGAQFAAKGLVTARTNADAPKHKGITTMVVEMSAPGIEIRPLRQPDGSAHFNEVFLTDVFVPDADVVGAIDDGWNVARANLGNESISVGRDDSNMSTPATTLLDAYDAHPERMPGGAVRIGYYVAGLQVLRLLNLRRASRALAGAGPGPEGAITKLVMSELAHEVAAILAVAGAPDLVFVDGDGLRPALLNLTHRIWSIGGGTSEIKRNQIGERILGLPRDPLLK
ncbi:acyl-CoA dehydrogenase [Pseudofrankia inefficax]|uniref:Acyl-CoA dehydrogenase domain-containing protein n=1 Tax=Pseudofrankia inefficax (strain DSM 45817 / CECT 9037 / DDB 130130 / EuI1c) TaxID=298654 RepID=E3J7W9_PSEI1|nr:acyl-CoA dehydrogenase [Pseudofrankia inefficax]ADP80873.1 acyl-CoA dehydrogenase domain-containing protein [Pseudofrankia inefficax]